MLFCKRLGKTHSTYHAQFWALPKERTGVKPAALLGLESRLTMQELVDDVKQVRLNVTLCT